MTADLRVSLPDVTDTTTPDLLAPGQTGHLAAEQDSTAEVARLEAYLSTAFPEEMVRSNTQRPETPVEIAIRLLSGLAARVPPSQQERCPEAYCNKTVSHRDTCGWVHYQ